MHYGGTQCSATLASGKNKGTQCSNKAYKVRDGEYYCAVHGKGGEDLPKNPHQKADTLSAIKAHNETVLSAAQTNAALGARGTVASSKMRMMKPVRHLSGFLTVFPNNKHGSRADGQGIPELSPMRLGPVKHGQPGLPDALNLENYWQGSKMLEDESLDQFRARQEELFNDKEPHRHAPLGRCLFGGLSGEPIRHAVKKGSKLRGWVYTHEDGTVEYLGYLEARPHYCRNYEELALKTGKIRQLRKDLDSGVNINIVGYDSRDCEDITPELIKEWYEDDSFPFGHECVIAALLLDVRFW